MVASAGTFRQFVQREFPLGDWASRQRDGARKNPQVSPGLIFRAIIMQAVLSLGSLLQLDHWLRGTSARAWLENQGKRRGSDTTFLKALGQWDLKPARAASYALHRWLCGRGWAGRTLASGRKVKLAVADGSCLGGMWTVALGFAGVVWQMVDVQRTRGKGHELAGARALLSRARKRLGPGWATHILYDGLMVVRKDFTRALLQWGAPLVVKTTEESLEVVQSCRDAWSKTDEETLRRSGVEIVRGLDVGRAMEYVVYAQGGILWEGLAWPLKVAWVRQTHLKGKYANHTEEYWVLSTDLTLSAPELWELARTRWVIENLGFKALNAAIGSKQAYLKNDHARQAHLIMGSLGYALEEAYEQWIGQQPGWAGWGVHKTRLWVARVLEWSANELTECGSSP